METPLLIRRAIFSLFFFLLLSLAVMAIGNTGVTLTTPVNETWVNTSNYTAGFVFQWADNSDSSIQLATCELYVQNVTQDISTIISEGNLRRRTFGVGNNTATTFYMNKTFNFIGNYSTQWWTIRCENASSSPTSGYHQHPRAIFHDVTFPQIGEPTKSFTNKTWVSSVPRIEVEANDSGPLYGQELTCELMNASRVFASVNLTNGTRGNLSNSSMADGLYSDLRTRCRDPAGNINTSFLMYNVTLDATSPSVSFLTKTPQDGQNYTNATIVINVSITESNVNTIVVEFDGTNVTLSDDSAANCNATTSPRMCNLTRTGFSEERDVVVKAYVNDSAGTMVTATRTFSIDLFTPRSLLSYNWTIDSSQVTYKHQFNETSPITCLAKIYDRDSTLLTTKTATIAVGYNANNVDANCTGTFNASDITTEGAFTIKFNLTSSNGSQTESTAQSGVLTFLYSGWNVYTHLDSQRSIQGLCNETLGCTKASFYNSSFGVKSFSTYDSSTPTVNDDITIYPGDAILLYVNQTSYKFQNDYTPAVGDARILQNITISGWNIVGLLSNATMNGTVFSSNFTGPALTNTTHVSWLNSTSGKFYSCLRKTQKCTGTSAALKTIKFQKGYAVFILADGNYTLNKTRVTA